MRPSSGRSRWIPGVAVAIALTLVSGVVWAVRPSAPPVVEVDSIEALTSIGHLAADIDGAAAEVSVTEFSGIFRDLRSGYGGTNLSVPFDIEIDPDPSDDLVGERMTVTARAGSGTAWTYTVTRGVLGTAQAWSADATVYRVWPDGSTPLVNRANVGDGIQYVATVSTTGFHDDALGAPLLYSPGSGASAWFVPDTVRIADPVANPDAKVLVAKAATTDEVEKFEGLPAPIDGITLVEGDVLLIREQEDRTENGLWVVSEGEWERWAPDIAPLSVVAPAVTEPLGEPLHGGSIVEVADGDAYGDTTWILGTTTSGVVSLGSDPIFFSEFNPTDGCLDADGAPKDVNEVRVWFKQDRTYDQRELTIVGKLGSLPEDPYSVPSADVGNGTTEYRTFASEDDLKEIEGSATLDISADVAEVEDISTWWVTESRWNDGGATCYPDGRAAAYTAGTVAWNQPEIQQIRLTNFDRPQNETQHFDLYDFGPAENEIQTLNLTGVGGNVNEVQQVSLGDFRAPVNETQQVTISGFDTRYNEQRTVSLNGFDAAGTDEQQFIAWSGFDYPGQSETQRLTISAWDTPGTNESQRVYLSGFDVAGQTEIQRVQFPYEIKAASDEIQRIEFDPITTSGGKQINGLINSEVTVNSETQSVSFTNLDPATEASTTIGLTGLDPATPQVTTIAATGFDTGLNERQIPRITGWDNSADAFLIRYTPPGGSAVTSYTYYKQGGSCSGSCVLLDIGTAAKKSATETSLANTIQLLTGGTVAVSNLTISACGAATCAVFQVDWAGAKAKTDLPNIELLKQGSPVAANNIWEPSFDAGRNGTDDESFTVGLAGFANTYSVTASESGALLQSFLRGELCPAGTCATVVKSLVGGVPTSPSFAVTFSAPLQPTVTASNCVGYNAGCTTLSASVTTLYQGAESFTLNLNSGGSTVASQSFRHASESCLISGVGLWADGLGCTATWSDIDAWLEAATTEKINPSSGGNLYAVSFTGGGSGITGVATSGTFTVSFRGVNYPGVAPPGLLSAAGPPGGSAVVDEIAAKAAESFSLTLLAPIGTGTPHTFTHGVNATPADIQTALAGDIYAAGFLNGGNVTVTGTSFTGATTAGSVSIAFGGQLATYDIPPLAYANGAGSSTGISRTTPTEGTRRYFQLRYLDPTRPSEPWLGTTFFYSTTAPPASGVDPSKIGYWYNPSGGGASARARAALVTAIQTAVRNLLLSVPVAAMDVLPVGDLIIEDASSTDCTGGTTLSTAASGFCMRWRSFSVPGQVFAYSHTANLVKNDASESYNKSQGRAADRYGFSFDNSTPEILELSATAPFTADSIKSRIELIEGFEGSVTVTNVVNGPSGARFDLTFGGASGFMDVKPVEGRLDVCDPRPCTTLTTLTSPPVTTSEQQSFQPSDWLRLDFGESGAASGKVFRGEYTAAAVAAAIESTPGFSGSVYVCPFASASCDATGGALTEEGFTVTFAGAYSFTPVADLAIGEYLDAYDDVAATPPAGATPNLCVPPPPSEESGAVEPDPSLDPAVDPAGEPSPEVSVSSDPAPCRVELAVPSALADYFVLSFSGQSTAPISFPAGSATDATLALLIKTRLEALPAFAAVGGRAAGTVGVELVSNVAGTRVFDIVFGGGLAAQPVAGITIAEVYSPPESPTPWLCNGSAADPSCGAVVQTAGIYPDRFTLSFKGQTSPTPISKGVNDSVAGITAAIQAIPGFQGTVTVQVCAATDATCNATLGLTSGGTFFGYDGGALITFGGKYSALPQDEFGVVSSDLAGAPAPCSMAPCINVSEFRPYAGADTFQLAFDVDGDGAIQGDEWSPKIQYSNYTYASVKAAIEEIPDFAGTATVTAKSGCTSTTKAPGTCGFVVEFAGDYGYQNLGAQELQVVGPVAGSATPVCGATLADATINTCTVATTRAGGADRFRLSWLHEDKVMPTYSDPIVYGQTGSTCTSLTACASSPVNTALQAMGEGSGVLFTLSYFSTTLLRFQISGTLAERDVPQVGSYAGIATSPSGDPFCTECSYNIGGTALALTPSQYEAGRPERSFQLRLGETGTPTATITNRAISYTKANLESLIETALGDPVTVAGITGNNPTAAASGSGFKVTFGVAALSPNRYQDLDLLEFVTMTQLSGLPGSPVAETVRGRPASEFSISFDPTPDTQGDDVTSAAVPGDGGTGSFSSKASAITAAINSAAGGECVIAETTTGVSSGSQNLMLTFSGPLCQYRDLESVTLSASAKELALGPPPSPSNPDVQNNGHVRSRFYLNYTQYGDGDGGEATSTVQSSALAIQVKGTNCKNCDGVKTTFTKADLETTTGGLSSGTTFAGLDSKGWTFFDVEWTSPSFQNVGPLGIASKFDMGEAIWTEVYRGQPAAFFKLGYKEEVSPAVAFPESYEAAKNAEKVAIQDAVLAAVQSLDPDGDGPDPALAATVSYVQSSFSYTVGTDVAPNRDEVVQVRFVAPYADRPMALLDLRDLGPSGLVIVDDLGRLRAFNAPYETATVVRTSAGDEGYADVQSDLTNEGSAEESADLLVDLAVPDLMVDVSPLIVEQNQSFSIAIEGNDIATLGAGGTVNLAWEATPRTPNPSVGASAGSDFADLHTSVSLTAGDDIAPTDYTVWIPCTAEVGEYDLVATVEGVTDLSGVPYTIEFPFVLEVVPSTQIEVRQFIKDDVTGGDLALNGGFTVTKPKGSKKTVSSPGTFRSETYVDITDACLGERLATVAFDKGRNEVQRVGLEKSETFTVRRGESLTPVATITPTNYDNVSVEAAINTIMPDGSWVDVDNFDATGFTVTFHGGTGTANVLPLVVAGAGASVRTIADGVNRSVTPSADGRTYDLVLEAPTGFQFQKTGSVTISGSTKKVDTYSKLSKGLAGSSTLSSLTGSVLKVDKAFESLTNNSKTLSLRLDALGSQVPNLRLYVMTRLTWVGSTPTPPGACVAFPFLQVAGWDGWNGGAAGDSVLRYADLETHTQDLHHTPGSPVITTAATLPGGSAGGSYSLQLTGAFGGGGYTFTSTDLPEGFSLSSGGLLAAAAIPAMGTYRFTVAIASSNTTCGETTKTFSLTVS